MSGFTFDRRHHIQRGSDFRRAYARRCSASNELLIVYGYENELEHARLGLSVSRKYGPAVARNRWKRLAREAFRLSQSELPRGIDLVLLPRNRTEPTLEFFLIALPKLAARVQAKLASLSRQARQ